MAVNFALLFPYSVFESPWLAPLALLLDLLLADPSLPWPHPVVLIGHLISRLEQVARPLAANHAFLGRLLGLCAVLITLSCTAVLVRLLLVLPYVGSLLALYLAWAGLAMGSLLQTGRYVLDNVEHAPLHRARAALSMLVSRETSTMDRALMRKTLADTMTENFTDALTAPFFWLLLTGPVGLWIYKASSTMDSMWGYLTPKWRYLGWAAARSDDLLALIPARISILAVWLLSVLHKIKVLPKPPYEGHFPGFLLVHTQALGMPSPNSGCPMAAFAWLLHCPMAGPSVYFGTNVLKPWLGPPKEQALRWNETRLRILFQTMLQAALVGMLSFWFILALCTLF